MTEREEQILSRLLDIWESAVKGTHSFLSENDSALIKPEVYQGLKEIEFLYGYYDNTHILQGFIGVANEPPRRKRRGNMYVLQN